jgi:hypothetical protein
VLVLELLHLANTSVLPSEVSQPNSQLSSTKTLTIIGDFGGDRRGAGRYGDRYGDRRGGYGGRRDDYRGGSRYDDYDRRGYGGGRDRDDNYRSRNIDRYESGGRDDRYGGRGDRGGDRGGERRGGGSGYYDRADDRAGFTASSRDEPREPYAGSGRDYASRDDRYGGR